MKNVIVILFTIILAVFIGTTQIIGDGGSGKSFKNVAEGVATKASSELTTISTSTAASTTE